jgi:hypothetical protein
MGLIFNGKDIAASGYQWKSKIRKKGELLHNNIRQQFLLATEKEYEILFLNWI